MQNFFVVASSGRWVQILNHTNMTKKLNHAFSLIELSIVILIVGVLMSAIGQGLDLLADMKVAAAKQLTQSSRVASLKNLELWMETTMESSFTPTEAADSSSVTTWYDLNPQVSNKNNAVQTESAKKPVYAGSAINGMPALRFNGTSSYLKFTGQGFYSGSAGATTFVVATHSGSDTGSVFRSSALFVSIGLGSVTGDTTTVKCGRSYNSATSSAGSFSPASAPAITKGQPVICTSRYNGAQVQGWTNGASPDTADSLTGNIAAATSDVAIGALTTTVGATTNSSEHLSGYIGEIIFFSRALSQKEMDVVETYLSKKWGIKIS